MAQQQRGRKPSQALPSRATSTENAGGVFTPGLVLEAKTLACMRGGRLVFSGLDFAVKSGEVLELRGPNGSGKSSLLRLIAGLNSPCAGTLELSGAAEPIAELSHYVGHMEAVKPALSVRQNIDFWAAFMGGTGEGALKTFRLEHLAGDDALLLSEGQRRRLALSRLMAVPRPLWLLDEPTVGLDATALADLRSAMQQHVTQGGLIIAATHAPLGLAGARQLTTGLCA